MSTLLSVNDLSFSIHDKSILHNINFSVEAGQMISLLGPSGCGKTSLLKLIAGFMQPSSGTIHMNGSTVSSKLNFVPPEKRNVGMVFQNYALFPHLSVFANIVFGIKHFNKKQQRERVLQLLTMVGLEGFEKRFPHQLSGGQQQRVAIARALAPHPQLLMLDEPFASLDTNLRERLVRDLSEILGKLNIACILVTHDQREAFAISEKIAMIDEGRIAQWDSPHNIYTYPANSFVANFIGNGALIKAKVLANNVLKTELGNISCKHLSQKVGQSVDILIRPNDLVEDSRSDITATISHKFFRGDCIQYELDFGGNKLIINADHLTRYDFGDSVPFLVNPKNIIIFDNNFQSVC